MSERIPGYDLARAIAIFGMILVNFKFSLNAWGGNEILQAFVSLFEGRASALFVVLAGIGISLMTKSAKNLGALTTIDHVRKRLIKRGIFFILIGLAYSSIWPADILHFYGFYFLIVAMLVNVKDQHLIKAMVLCIGMFPVLFVFLNYDAGWDWNTYSYKDFWTINGMIRHIVFNGFHPIFPWFAFLLFGMWLGRQNLSNRVSRNKILIWSLMVLITTELTFLVIRSWGGSGLTQAERNLLFKTIIFPPMPQYMIAAGSLASFVVISCNYCCEWFADRCLIRWLTQMGKLSLTIYVMHVVIGIGILKLIPYDGKHNIIFSVTSAVVFCAFSVFFSVIWLRFFKTGPLECMLRKIT